MAKMISLTKRSMISKANSTIVLATSIAAFVVVFSLVASKALLSQAGYQNRVISGKKTALAQIKTDLSARNSLVASYNTFVSSSPNIVGGDVTGTSDNSGDNAKIVLDALPSTYDFPALTASIEKLVNSQNMQILNMTGTDEEARQQANLSSPTPQPVPMPFQLEVSGSYQSVQNLIGLFDKSIRPFQIMTMQLNGNNSTMTMTITAQTFFQPGKSLNIRTEVVK